MNIIILLFIPYFYWENVVPINVLTFTHLIRFDNLQNSHTLIDLTHANNPQKNSVQMMSSLILPFDDSLKNRTLLA